MNPVVAETHASRDPVRPTLTLQRVFDAPRDLVWRAWSNPEVLVLWMGPVEWPAISATADFRVGGEWRICLRSPTTGEDLWQGGVYRDIVAPERLVYTLGFVTDGFLAPNALATVTFVEANGRTTLTSTVWHNSRADRDAHLASGVEAGAAISFDRLEAHIRTMA